MNVGIALSEAAETMKKDDSEIKGCNKSEMMQNQANGNIRKEKVKTESGS